MEEPISARFSPLMPPTPAFSKEDGAYTEIIRIGPVEHAKPYWFPAKSRKSISALPQHLLGRWRPLLFVRPAIHQCSIVPEVDYLLVSRLKVEEVGRRRNRNVEWTYTRS